MQQLLGCGGLKGALGRGRHSTQQRFERGTCAADGWIKVREQPDGKIAELHRKIQ
ncbi:hypothetical protein RLV_2196 (plasmid) [Rhizobium leguminosarum bv. viciae]|nr:hypothetical protein RLV_2196 [Rhizobium leguminosarum bv. viciae]